MEITTGVVGIVGFAGQLVSGIQKLVEFWDSIKDAPAEVAYIKSQLRLLGNLLDNIESQALKNSSISPSDGAECLESVRSSIAKLEKLSQELDTGLNAKGVRRQWTKLKKAMREKELEKYTGELLNAKITLNIYQTLQNDNHQISNGAIITDINRNLQLLLASGRITKPQDQGLETARIPRNYRFRKIDVGKSTYEVRLSFGKIRFWVTTYVLAGANEQLSISEAIRRPRHREVKVLFSPFCTRVLNPLEWTVAQSTRGWKHLLHTFNLRPYDSLIFKLIILGDTKEIQRLLLEGSASVNDMDPFGQTVLSYALKNTSIDLYKFFLENGAMLYGPASLPISIPEFGEILVETAWFPKLDYNFNTNTSATKLLEYIAERSDGDLFESYISSYERNRFRSCSWRVPQWIFTQNIQPFEYNCKNLAILANRIDLSFEDVTFLAHKGVDVTIPRMVPDSDKMILFQRNGLSLIQNTIVSWFKYLSMSLCLFPDNRILWESLMVYWNDSTRPKLDLHCQSGSGETLLGLILNQLHEGFYTSSHKPMEHLNCLLAVWVEMVRDEGYDMREYIQHERSLLESRRYRVADTSLTGISVAGISAKIRFSYEVPWISFVFQGPEEMKENIFMEDITHCKAWKARHGLKNAEEDGESEEDNDKKVAPTTIISGINLRRKVSTKLHQVCQQVIWYIRRAIYYRTEFLVYLLTMSLGLGLSYTFAAKVSLLFYIFLQVLPRVAPGIFEPFELYEEIGYYWL